jgi:hypothetical protein
VTSVFTFVPLTALVLSAVVLGAIGLGGGIYETVLVDRAWPNNPAIIQPSRGGLNRGLFWAPVQMSYEVVLLLAAWMVWSNAYSRAWIIVALIAHFGVRAWSFLYFIPKALWFEKAGNLTKEQSRDARRWIRFSRCRPVLEAIAIISECAVVVHLGAATH